MGSTDLPRGLKGLRRAMLAGIALSTLTIPALGAPNGLTQIPIAKIFGDGVASFSLNRSVQQSQVTTYTTQYGIGNQFEVGLDYQAAPPEQKTLLANIKYLLAHRPGRLPDIAVGFVNLATGQKAVPYAVATTQPKATGVSLGIIRPAGDGYDGMAGISYNVTPTLEIITDYIGGRQSYGTLGFIDSLTKTITLNVAYAQPNSGDSPRGYIFNLAYTFHLKGGGNSSGQPQNPAAGSGGAGGQ